MRRVPALVLDLNWVESVFTFVVRELRCCRLTLIRLIGVKDKELSPSHRHSAAAHVASGGAWPCARCVVGGHGWCTGAESKRQSVLVLAASAARRMRD